jgi:hypothetical protein
MGKSLFLTDALAQTGHAFHFLFIVEADLSRSPDAPDPAPTEKRHG